ncbi:MAG: sulfatase [bacterium]|nr:sulfatase [bacterium]
MIAQRTYFILPHCLLIAAVAAPTIKIARAQTSSESTAIRSPNVVLILADDLGWSDLGCYGGDLVETPNLDRLAADSLRFTQAYAMSVCTPSRATLMTGRHAARLKMTIWSEGSLKGPSNRKLLQADALHDLPLQEITLAEQLKAEGYLTAAIGKWHLGDAGHFPEAQGFDINIGGNHWGAPQTFWWPYRGDQRYGGEFRYVPHMEFGKPGEYLTDRLTDEALQVIDKAGEQPFFLYLAHYAPHTPIEAKSEDVEYFRAKQRPEHHHQNPIYAAMLKNLDENIGRVIAHLKRKGIYEETILIFTSDNGGFIGNDRDQAEPVTSNAPLRSGKGSLYEGGIRVPMIIRWPMQTQPGSVCHQPVMLTDLLPTLTGLNSVADDNQETTGLDGTDLKPLLSQPERTWERTLFFHYPHYYPTTSPVSAVRFADWKLLEFHEDSSLELYDLARDPSESKNLADQYPQRAAQMLDELQRWRRQVDAAMPRPNPAYSSQKP